jgi:hypothetical protein
MLEGELYEPLINSPFSVELAMPEVEAPFVGSEVDSSDASGSAKSIAAGVAGVGLMTVVFTYGQKLGNWVTEQIDGATGMNGGSGDVIMGEF